MNKIVNTVVSTQIRFMTHIVNEPIKHFMTLIQLLFMHLVTYPTVMNLLLYDLISSSFRNLGYIKSSKGNVESSPFYTINALLSMQRDYKHAHLHGI